MNVNKSILWLLLVVTGFVSVSCKKQFRDQDGNSFKVVKIGNKLWMAENLNVAHFRNGDSIPKARSIDEWVNMGLESKPAWVFQQNEEETSRKYGRFYNWYVVNDPRGLAPKGWHIATDEEWQSMINYLGGEISAAMRIRSMGNTGPSQGTEENIFMGVPSGGCNIRGAWFSAGSRGYWWSATEALAGESWAYVLNYLECHINNQHFEKGTGFPVRCIKD